MLQEKGQIVQALNQLVETCKDGQDGFRSAAERAQDPDIQRLFNGYAGQRATFAAELQAEVRRQGGDPEKSGTVLGTLHRGWMNLMASVLSESDATLLEECEAGEDADPYKRISPPEYFDYDAWTGPAPLRPYDPPPYPHTMTATGSGWGWTSWFAQTPASLSVVPSLTGWNLRLDAFCAKAK